jgi:RNA polymerase sigma factor (sigma-70 family)
MQDQEIITAVKQGNVELFRLLVERYQGPLLGFINSITRDRFLTEDVGQAVFLSFFRNLQNFEETRQIPLAAWLFTVARNMAINAIKKERRYVAVESLAEERCDHRPGPLDLLIHKEDQAILAQCLAMLPEPYQTTILKSLQGRSIEEIAAQELILPGTVKSRLARARGKIIALFRAENTR